MTILVAAPAALAPVYLLALSAVRLALGRWVKTAETSTGGVDHETDQVFVALFLPA